MASVASLVSLVSLVSLSGCDDGTSEERQGFPEAPLTTMTSESGELRIEVRTSPSQPPTRGTIEVEYTVLDQAGQPVNGLDVHVQPWMPDHAHGTSLVPSVNAQGQGRYTVRNVALFMPGRWELRTALEPRSGSADPDDIVVTLQVP